MRLRAQMIDLIRPRVVDQVGELFPVGQIAVVQEQPGGRVVRVLVDVLDPVGVERAGFPNQTVDFIAFGEQEFGQIRSILAGDACNQGLGHGALLERPRDVSKFNR